MEGSKARLVVLIDPKHKAAFDAACASREVSASEMVRQMIEDYLGQHGVKVPAADDDARETA
jgi:hypothetical protein